MYIITTPLRHNRQRLCSIVFVLLAVAAFDLTSAFDIPTIQKVLVKCSGAVVTTGAAACSLLLSTTTLLGAVPAATENKSSNNNWDLLNGNVSLNDPINLSIPRESRPMLLSSPKLIGAGGGGAVFAFADAHGIDDSVLLKVSWKGTTKSVRQECRTLQLLEQRKVDAAERCLGEFPYNADDREDRVMIALQPYVRNAVASVELVDQAKQAVAVEQIAQTVVQMLAANIVTIDVQPLIDRHTGKVTFIDMTEAQELKPPFSFLDKSLMGAFVTEMLTLIPETWVDTASKAMVQEIESLKDKSLSLSEDAKDVLYSQTLFFPE